MGNKCKKEVKYKSVILINPKDIKSLTKDGVIIKRKYGKFDRKIYGYDLD